MRKVFSIFRGLITALSMIIYLIPYGIRTIFKKHTPRSGFNLRRAWTVIGNPILGHRIQVRGQKYDGVAIYMSNHRSFSDPLIQAKFFDAFIIAKAEVAEIPLMNHVAQITGIIYVKRESLKSRKDTRAALVTTLLDGHNVLIYPEGTTGDLELTKPFKKGAFFSAAEHKIPVVPVAIEYRDKDDYWVGTTLLKHFIKQYSKWSTTVAVSIGEPISSDDGLELLAKTKAWIDEELVNIREGWSSKITKV